MFKTRVTELLGIKHPIVGGCMMRISGLEFVAAISNAGALGMMASAMFDTQEKFRQAVRRAKDLTGKPFGVNLSLFPALRPIDNDLYVEVILEEGIPVVETSGHRPPEDLLGRLKAGEVKTMHKCVSVRHALSAQKAGVDAVTVLWQRGRRPHRRAGADDDGPGAPCCRRARGAGAGSGGHRRRTGAAGSADPGRRRGKACPCPGGHSWHTTAGHAGVSHPREPQTGVGRRYGTGHAARRQSVCTRRAMWTPA